MHNNFQKILDHFQQQGFSQDSYMRESDLIRVLDKCAKANTSYQKFDRQILNQLWQNTLKNDEGDCVLLKDFIQTLCQAQDILKEKIRMAQDKYSAEINEQKRKDYMVSIYSLTQDQKMVCTPFKINDESPSKLIQLSLNSINPNDKTSTSIFADEVNIQHKLSHGLTIVTYLTFLSLLLELISMIGKFHFYGLLVQIFLAAIFLLNYFDRVYIRFVLINLILSIVFDAVWLAMKINDYWNPPQGISIGKLDGLLKFIVITTIIVGINKSLCAIILFKYRGNPHGLRKKANFFILQFNLDANPIRNPMTPVIQKTFPKFLIR